MPVTVGVGSDGTALSLALAEEMTNLGADCLLVIPPIYFDHSFEAQLTHYVTLAASTSLPIMLYDGSNGISVPPSVVKAACQEARNIRYIKVATPDPRIFADYRREVPEVTPIVGDDMMLLPGLLAGGEGSATAIGNLVPTKVADLHRCVVEEDLDQAHLIAADLAPITMFLSMPKPQFIVKFKEILYSKGIIASPFVRPPLTSLSERDRQNLMVQASLKRLL